MTTYSICLVSIVCREISRKILLRSMSKSMLPIFFSRCFMVPGLTFKSLIYFMLIFLYGVREWSSSFFFFFFFVCSCLVSQHHLRSLLLFHKLVVYICKGLFLGSQFCSIDLFICFSANTMLVLSNSLKSGSVMPPAFFYFASWLLWQFEGFHDSI